MKHKTTTLTLTINRKWFDLIKAGVKKYFVITWEE